MIVKELTTAAAISAVALAITAGTAHAQPAPLPTVNGTDHGVSYQTSLSTADRSVITTVDTGLFSLSQNASTVTLSDSGGAPIAQIPLTYQVAGTDVAMAPSLGDAGRTLTLTAIQPAAAQPIANTAGAQDINSQQEFIEQMQRAAPGALVGGVIGLMIGMIPFGTLAVPGAVIGATIGLVTAGGPALANAAQNYFSGQP